MPEGRFDFKKLHVLAAQVTGANNRSVMRCVLVFEKQIKLELSRPGHGRLYKRGKNRWHQASAPGEPPAVDYGDLRRSIGHELVGGAWRVGTGLARASALEFGHVYPDGRVLLPRPFMSRALRKVRRGMNDALVSDLIVRGKGVAD